MDNIYLFIAWDKTAEELDTHTGMLRRFVDDGRSEQAWLNNSVPSDRPMYHHYVVIEATVACSFSNSS